MMNVPEHAVHYLEIVASDPEAACRLYGSAFGWTFLPQKPELGHARVAEIPGGSLCGIRAPMHKQETPVVRTYLRVPDIEAAVEKAVSLGAQLALEPTEIAGHGKVAIYFIGGIQQGVWQVP